MIRERLTGTSVLFQQPLHEILTVLLAFFLPMDRRICTLLTVLLVLNWVFVGRWRDKWQRIVSHVPPMLPALLYLLYLAGMTYSVNSFYGLRDLETKLSLFAMPVLYIGYGAFGRLPTNQTLKSFAFGCLVSMVVCLVHAVYCYLEARMASEAGTYISTQYFFSLELSWFMHPGYFAMYLSFTIAIAFCFALGKGVDYRSRLAWIMLALSCTVFIFFLTSRVGMLAMTLEWLAVIAYIVYRKKRYLSGLMAVAGLTGLSVLLYHTSEVIASRYDYVLTALQSEKPDPTSLESSTVRLLIWKESLGLIVEQPWYGAGTGDVKDMLLHKYEEAGMTGAYEHNLNAHNQFFQTTIALGIPGGLLISFCLWLPLWEATRRRNGMLLAFLTIVLLNFIGESVLESQAGVIFYAFFNSLLFTSDWEFTE